VKLDIKADEEITNEIHSYISRELRSLGDVEVVKKNPKYIIQIVAVALVEETNTGRHIGVALSTVTLQPLSSNRFVQFLLDEQIKGKVDDHSYKSLKNLVNSANYCYDHSLRSGNREDLQIICKKVVATFDVEILNADRELHRKETDMFYEALKELREKKTK